ncbi:MULTISPECIES: NADP-dependent oxidoreductase [unclassified Rhizobium]|uniref:NADP-dependent oxidoreductase n=1 Tax=unclassified Rhizobium TaxID=2613769 RepID=UPI001ADBC08E|nr:MULTISPECIES: NADP-dependent oxidoreductase [unclassified Rhizobium]MBO9126256.1 NADP-dependent oxidoreductase [Rhizobium sp. 16-488-2b]MBO9176840.1 NADP-dependent oxidoreductase [Rhizobium sp. 16-488-2a]MBO9197409.1 NADP-dependent oxidoreductase [Rhizobium sp. 16-449-1b]
MKAYALERYGAALTPHDLPEPIAGPGQVVVEIDASSVNPLDEKLRTGAFKAILHYDMPLVLGHDLAGIVVAVGEGVRRWQVGDRVFACVGGDRIGTFAERIAVAEADLAPLPANLDPSAAAALPLVSLTAWQVLVERAKVRAGQRVLIHAGSGGVGTMAIQLAKHLGAYVATTVGTANVALARDLGADEVIDYRQEPFEERLSGYDMVLDTRGGDVTTKSLGVLKPGGMLVSIVGPPDPAFARTIGANWMVRQVIRLGSFSIRRKARARGIEYGFLFMRPDGGHLAEIGKLVEAGALRPIIDREFVFEDTPAALERSASGRARGKVVIRRTVDA